MMALRSKAKIIEDCAVHLQRIVRMRAALEINNPYISCVTCGKVNHWKNMDGGHYISRTYTAHKLCVSDVHPILDAQYEGWASFGNIHPQCKGCNRFSNKCHDDYAKWMRDWYGDKFVNYLTESKHTPKNYDRAEITALLKDIKNTARDMEKQCDQLTG